MHTLEHISDKQREILDFIKQRLIACNYPPSVREICEAVHLKSTSSVHAHLACLEKAGYIKRDPSKPRAIEILEDNFQFSQDNIVYLPIIGDVACGEPIFADQNIEGHFPVPMDYIQNVREAYLLRVRGDSMMDIGIFHGDLLICEKTSTVRNGQVAVCLLEDTATVKRFYKENGRFRLQPENSHMDPIYTDSVEIIGRPVGLFRKGI